MNNQTIIKDVHVSPKKIRFLMDFVKKLKPVDAIDHLAYMSQHSARILKTAIQAAISSSVSALKTTPDMLKFRVLIIDQGHVLKRFRAGGRGTAKPIKRRMAHIKIVLEVDQPGQKKIESRKEKIEKMIPEIIKKNKETVKPKRANIKKTKKVINKKS